MGKNFCQGPQVQRIMGIFKKIPLSQRENKLWWDLWIKEGTQIIVGCVDQAELRSHNSLHLCLWFTFPEEEGLHFSSLYPRKNEIYLVPYTHTSRGGRTLLLPSDPKEKWKLKFFWSLKLMHPEGKGHQFSSLILKENRDFWAAHRHLGHGIDKGRSQGPEDSRLSFLGAGMTFPGTGVELPGSRTEIPGNIAGIPGSSGLRWSKAEFPRTRPELPGDQGQDLLSKEMKEGGKEPRRCCDAAFPEKREVWSWELWSQEYSKKPAKTRAKRRDTTHPTPHPHPK